MRYMTKEIEKGKFVVTDSDGRKVSGWYWGSQTANDVANELNARVAELEQWRWKWGWLRNKHSWWMGVHYSAYNKRWCINLIPCFTVWITKPGGKTP